VLPSTHDGQPAPGLRFGDPTRDGPTGLAVRVRPPFEGLTNRSLRALVADVIPGYTTRQMTYDLGRLRRKGLIRRIPRSQRYQLTSEGRRLAVFFTKTYTRIVNPSLAELDPTLPAQIASRSPLAASWRAFEHALDARIASAALTS
jgi:hypothetical protein